jgi:hypothetical protein
MRWVGHLGLIGERRGEYSVLVGNPEEKGPLGRPKHRWAYNVKMNLQEVECGGKDLIELAQVRDRWQALLTLVMNIRVLQNAGNFLTS